MGKNHLEELAAKVLEAAKAKGLLLGCAESCTGGMVAAALTAIPGSSDSFVGGIVSYWARIKEEALGVDPSIIERCGVVSCECAEAMAEGARRALETDLAVSTTGIAGPGGASPTMPVGTVWIACSSPLNTVSTLLQASGDRRQVRLCAAEAALGLMLDCIERI